MRSFRHSWRRGVRSGGLLLVAVALLAAASGCSTAATPVGGLEVTGAWVRPPAGPGLPAAGYLTIANRGGTADALVGVSSPSAGRVEMHRTTTASGMTGMEPVAAIHVPAGGTVSLRPGSFHLMLMEVQELSVGQTVELVLTFEQGGQLTIQAEVRNG